MVFACQPIGSIKIYILSLFKEFLRELGNQKVYFYPLAPLYNTIGKVAKSACLMPRVISHNFLTALYVLTSVPILESKWTGLQHIKKLNKYEKIANPPPPPLTMIYLKQIQPFCQ